MKTIADRIKELRLTRGMTQKELARKLGITSVSVSKWEADLAKPKSDSLIELCKIFDVDIDWLQYGRETKVNYGLQHESENDEVILIPHFEDIDKAFKSVQNLILNESTRSLVIPKNLTPTNDNPNLISFRFFGDTMFPVIPPNAIVCADLDKRTPIDGVNFVIEHNGLIRVGCIERTPEGIIMKRHNANYQNITIKNNDNFFIIGAVIMQLSFF